MPAANVVAIPDAMSFADATVIEPLAVILHVLELVKIRLGDTVAVMGAGPIGLLTATVARMPAPRGSSSPTACRIGWRWRNAWARTSPSTCGQSRSSKPSSIRRAAAAWISPSTRPDRSSC